MVVGGVVYLRVCEPLKAFVVVELVLILVVVLRILFVPWLWWLSVHSLWWNTLLEIFDKVGIEIREERILGMESIPVQASSH